MEPAGQLGGPPVSVSVQLAAEAEIALRAGEHAMVLNIEDIELDRMPGGYYEIYLNLPEGQTPNFRSQYYIGNLTFFGIKPRTEGMEGEKPSVQSYNITEIVRKLRSAGEWRPGEVKVTFIRRTVIPPPGIRESEVEGSPVKIGRVTITTE